MTSSIDIALVIPCYNEERRLNIDVFQKELLSNPNLSFLFVNDGSKDNTLSIMHEICKVNPERSFSLSLDRNMGKGEAVRIGMNHLLARGIYDFIGFWDADLAVPLSEVWDFVNVFKANPETAVVIGSRVHLAGRQIEHVNLRHYLGRLFATVMCITFHFTIYDTQCGAKIFRKDALSPAVQEPFCSKWIFDVELILRISRLPHLKNRNNWLLEVPVKTWRNISGTKRNVSTYTNAFVDYIKMVRKYWRHQEYGL